MLRLVITIVAILSLLTVSCEENNITNNYTASVTSAMGLISPADIGEVWAYKTGDSAIGATASIGTDGYFMFERLSPGNYEFRVVPSTYSQRRLTNITVLPEKTTQLGVIAVSTLPYPIFDCRPRTGMINVSREYRSFTFLTDEALDTASLSTGATITPPVTGTWRVDGDRYCHYVLDSYLSSSTTYTITLSTIVKTTSGRPLDKELEIVFSTEPLTATVHLPSANGIDAGMRLSGFWPEIRFNDSLCIDSIREAIRFEPNISGEWTVPTGYASNFWTIVRFLPSTGALQASTHYKMIVANDVNLIGQIHLATPDTTEFTTEPYGASLLYPYSTNPLSPWSDVQLGFNAVMDTLSVNAAFSIADGDSVNVPINIHWGGGTYLYALPFSGTWQSGHGYTVKVSTSAKTLSGVNLSREFEFTFSVY